MTLTIFLIEKDFTRLNRIVPVGSHSKKVLARAVHFESVAGRFSARNYVLTCEEAEARNLLMYAEGECPGAAAGILEAFRGASLAPEIRG
jgi:transcriptional regulator of acetoin/glycerol metabolism